MPSRRCRMIHFPVGLKQVVFLASCVCPSKMSSSNIVTLFHDIGFSMVFNTWVFGMCYSGRVKTSRLWRYSARYLWSFSILHKLEWQPWDSHIAVVIWLAVGFAWVPVGFDSDVTKLFQCKALLQVPHFHVWTVLTLPLVSSHNRLSHVTEMFDFGQGAAEKAATEPPIADEETNTSRPSVSLIFIQPIE